MTRSTLVVVVAAVVALSGCSGPLVGEQPTPTATVDSPTVSKSPTPKPTATPEATPTPDGSDSDEVTVRGGTLPVNATEIWYRFLDLRGFDRDRYRPPVIRVDSPPTEGIVRPITRYAELAERLGVRAVNFDPEDVDEPGGMFTSSGPIVIYPRNGTAEEIERVLVHEFEHYVQPHDSFRRLGRPVTEGAAVYVGVEYAERYLESLSPVASRRTDYVDGTGALKLNAADYYFGYRYVDRRIDSPKELDRVYEDPPETASQLLHGHDWNASRPLPVETGESLRASNVPAGELFLRVTLATELNESTAARAAAGWANDTVVEQDGFADESAGNVWVLRTTDERNATELASTFERFLDARATDDGDHWRANGTVYRLVRVDPTTLAVVLGDEDFVDEVVVSKNGETVVVKR